MGKAGKDPMDWIEKTYRRLMLGFSFRDPEQIELTTGKPVPPERREAMQRDVDEHLDADIYVQALKRMGIQVFHHHAKNHSGVSCYPTKVGHTFSLMGDRDFFGEMVTACRKAGIVPGAMYQVGYDMLHAAQHPDWLQMDATGKRCVFTLCPNNPHWRAIAMGQTEEIAHYDIGAILFDELLIDWHNIGTACYCPECRKLFRREIGDDMPEQEDWDSPLWRRFVDWRYDKIVEFIEEADAIIKRVNPNIAHTCNYKGNPTRGWQRAWDCDRTGAIYEYLVNDIAGVLRVSRAARSRRAVSRRRPEIACGIAFQMGSYTHYHYSDKGVPKPRDMFFADVMTALANGVTPAFESMGWSNHRFWDKKKAIMCSPGYDKIYLEASQEIQRREPWLVDAQLLRYAALLHSRHTRDFRYHSEIESYSEGFVGWHEGLVNGQILHDMATEGYLTAEGLRPYKVLVLPNTACLSDDQVETIRAYVRGGGGLVASFNASLFDEDAKARGEFALADVLGISYQAGIGTDYNLRKNNPAQRDQYFMSLDEKHKFFKDILVPGERMSCPAPVMRVRALGDAKPVGRYTIHWHEGSKFEGRGDAISGRGRPEETDNPVLVTNRFGKGRVVYLSAKFAAAYKIYAHPYLHRLMMRAVRWAGGRSPVEVDTPPCIELCASRQETRDRLIVHLVNYQSVPFRGLLTEREPLLERILPVHDLTVTAQVPRGRKIKKVYLAPDKKPLKWKKEASSRIRIAVPKIRIHGMVVVEFGK